MILTMRNNEYRCFLSACLPSILFNINTGRQHYRLYTIHKIPTLKVLDFQKVKQSEKERAQRLASSAAGAAMEADARLEARAAAQAASNSPVSTADDVAFTSGTYGDNGTATNTFEPGEGKSAEESFSTKFTAEEKAKIRDLVANAASAEEIDRIERLVKRGVFPGSSSESGGKRSAEGGEEEGGDSKRQRSE